MNKKFVIVLILSYNGKNLLDDSISSYLANDYQNFKVVLIDNGSTDGTKEYVEQKWSEVKILHTEINLKYSGGFNFGLKYAFKEQNADYVLITNNDVKADSKVISSCVQTAQINDKVSFVTGKAYYFDLPDTFQSCGKKHHPVLWSGEHIGGKEKDIGQYDNEVELSWCDDIFWLVSKEVYTQIGGYNTEFAFQSEDFEWQARAKKHGFKIYFSPNAKLWHKESMTLKQNSPVRLFYTYRNPLIVYMMHGDYQGYCKAIRLRRRNLFLSTLIWACKLKWVKLFFCWKGHFSAMKWGIKNNKISFVNSIVLR